jgi:hypothetical protein
MSGYSTSWPRFKPDTPRIQTQTSSSRQDIRVRIISFIHYLHLLSCSFYDSCLKSPGSIPSASYPDRFSSGACFVILENRRFIAHNHVATLRYTWETALPRGEAFWCGILLDLKVTCFARVFAISFCVYYYGLHDSDTISARNGPVYAGIPYRNFFFFPEFHTGTYQYILGISI